ncbi:MAG: MBL fold metallo-hydrolase [Candidatus Verstraetearchaeota archaeon]|nr:MBL fold metallo-hydrolase [Candidatus Verstraetearchaeota archaeon]
MIVMPITVPFPKDWGHGDGTNAYIIKGDKTILIDSGLDGPDNREYIKRTLRRLDAWRVDAILLTHGHLDHFGLGAYLQRETGAKIMIHEEDAPALKDYRNVMSWFDEVYELAVEGGFDEQDLRAVKMQLSMVIDMMSKPDNYGTFSELDLKMGGGALRSMHLPGHTPGSVGYILGDSIFSGDVALDGPTNVGELRQELASIQRLKTFKHVYTGHRRSPINAKDLEALEAHIASRLEQVLRITKQGRTLKEIVSGVYGVTMVETNFMKKVIPIRQVVSYLRYLEDEGHITKRGARWVSFKDHL